MSDPHLIKRISLSAISPLEQEMVRILCFLWILNSRTLITKDREDGDGVERYPVSFMVLKEPFVLIPYFIILHVLIVPFL